MAKWNCVLELDSQRQHVAGSTAALSSAICAGADLRVGTGFLHNEHIDKHHARKHETRSEIISLMDR